MAGILSGLLLLLAGGAAASAAEVELGTLFFTPSERSAMERLRRGENITIGNSADAVVNGYIKRSDGVNTVWIDGKPFRTDAERLARVHDLPIGASTSVQVRSGRSAEPASRKADSMSRRQGAERVPH